MERYHTIMAYNSYYILEILVKYHWVISPGSGRKRDREYKHFDELKMQINLSKEQILLNIEILD